MKVCAIPAGTGGVAFYRMQQPLRDLQRQGHEIFIFDPVVHDGNRLYDEQKYADIIIYQCPWSEGILQAVQLIKEKEALGRNKKVVIELDDNLFNVDPWNEKYNMFGTEEIKLTVDAGQPEIQQNYIDAGKEEGGWSRHKKLKDGSMEFDMWRDGYCDFNMTANRLRFRATEELLKIADLVTVTTMELGKQLQKYSGKTRIGILPNYVDFDRWLPMEENETDEIRIGWQGGSAHFDDLRLIIKDLKAIHDKYNGVSPFYKKVRFCFMGIHYTSLFQEFGEQIDYFPWHGDVETYPLMVRQMKLDIALAPLKDTMFNRGKSPLKWCEYSALGVPTIASEIVYGDYIDHRKTGLIARDGEWFKYIDQLIQDQDKRQYIASNAYRRVKFKYNEDNSALWLATLKDIL